VSSGVEGLDKLLGGGYKKERTTLIAGGPGSGKSILTWHFLHDGIQSEENCVLLSLDQSSEMIVTDMGELDMNPQAAIDSKKITLLSGTLDLVPTPTGYDYYIGFEQPRLREQPFTVPRLAELVKKEAANAKATRVVVDGLGPLIELAGNRFEMRQMVYGFMREIAAPNLTVLLTHELRTGPGSVNDEMPFFISDTVLRLAMVYSAGDYVRTLRIVKMRGSEHTMRPVMFKITGKGITVFPDARLAD
jgi:circadian clock protein KaiC